MTRFAPHDDGMAARTSTEAAATIGRGDVIIDCPFTLADGAVIKNRLVKSAMSEQLGDRHHDATSGEISSVFGRLPAVAATKTRKHENRADSRRLFHHETAKDTKVPGW
jgi:hypothetical protein